ncbi:hypothetical protein D7Z26_06815 [Cohnella endophytica]|uniref:Uncharacterized protein n=1 Tax=Cohnella endophytica TaxID=2419778 RepID=A0A494XWG1_9BACL|nr:hypothetical protein [Cohnella endophytica]RKP54945.1 hypothetical protein D7Z26_06815 [Cohnella endophytica]
MKKSIESIMTDIQDLSKQDRHLLWELLDLKYDVFPKVCRIYVDESNNPWGPEDDYWDVEYKPNERDEQDE